MRWEPADPLPSACAWPYHSILFNQPLKLLTLSHVLWSVTTRGLACAGSTAWNSFTLPPCLASITPRT